MRLDIAQESRPLTPLESQLRKTLKLKVIGLAAIERARRRQASRVTWLRVGDANTKFFHAKMNARRRKNFISSLSTGARIATSHEDKAEILHQHFAGNLGSTGARPYTLDWASLDLPTLPLAV